MANTIMTIKGREKLCKAHAGARDLPTIQFIAFGTGGVDENRIPFPVTGEEISLREEQCRIELQYNFPIPTTCEYLSTLNKEDLPNMYLSELGFFDGEGDLVMYSTFMEKGKDEDMMFDFIIKEIF